MPKKAARRSIANKIKITYCDKCENEIKEETDDYIQCDKCGKSFHSLCSNLSRREFERLLKNENEIFKCNFCKEEGGEIRNELNAIKTELKKLEKLEKLDQLTESIMFMSAKFDEMFKEVAENKKKLNEIERENKKLKSELKSLKSSIKTLNDYRIRNDCIISGLKVANNLSALDAVENLSKNAGVSFQKSAVEDAYFLKNKNQNNDRKTVVVKFSSKAHKAEFMSSKAKLKEDEKTKNVFVNNFNSKETMNLFYHAKSLKTIGYQFVFIKNGRVYCKKSEASKQQLIYNEDDVDKILLNATTSKHRGRRSMGQSRQAEYEDPSEGDDEDGAPHIL